jgi:uncharacterized membrane protein YjjB (DUF3815 family)
MLKIVDKLFFAAFIAAAFITIFLGNGATDRNVWYISLLYTLGYLIYAMIKRAINYSRDKKMERALLKKAYSEMNR